jgi:hypothetical protein
LAVATPEPDRYPLRPSSIAGRGFTLARKGYERHEVHAFLTDVAEYVSRLQGEVEWLRARSEHLDRRSAAAQDTAYARLSRDFMDVVRRADEAATRVRLQAEAKAQSDLVIARRHAGRIIGEAKLEAERILAAARLEAHEIDWQSKVPEGHRSHPAQTQAPPRPEWRATPEPPATDLPTMAVDIAAIWEVEDAASWPLQESLPPQLFEEPSAPIHIPDEWLAKGRDMTREAPVEQRASDDPEDLDVHLDVSIFDLFDSPDD